MFDEAVYSKIQHIRWKEPEFFERFVVRLGEFHATMSFLSAMSKVFEDGGLKVKYIVFTCSSDNLKPFDWNIEAIYICSVLAVGLIINSTIPYPFCYL